jgi:hypothetical protein
MFTKSFLEGYRVANQISSFLADRRRSSCNHARSRTQDGGGGELTHGLEILQGAIGRHFLIAGWAPDQATAGRITICNSYATYLREPALRISFPPVHHGSPQVQLAGNKNPRHCDGHPRLRGAPLSPHLRPHRRYHWSSATDHGQLRSHCCCGTVS